MLMANSSSSGIVICKSFEVFFLPSLMSNSDLSRSVIVMTDVLRASTSMIAALEAGAATIWPHASIESARQAASEIPGSLLCGERAGKRIEGFDCGNSPREFCQEKVGDKVLHHCTTNGTVALESCRGAARILIGAFVNLKAVSKQLEDSERAVVLCAGTDGEVTAEDVLFAGAVGSSLLAGNPETNLNDQAQIAVGCWNATRVRMDRGEGLAGILAGCRGGRPLADLGYAADISYCAEVDLFDSVPELDQINWRVRQA